MAADRMAAVRAARSKPEDFDTYICKVCKQEHRVLRALKADVACEGGVPPTHRSEKLGVSE